MRRLLNNFVGGYAGAGTRIIPMMLKRAGIWVGQEYYLSPSYDTHHTLVDFARMCIPSSVTQDSFLDHFEEFRLGNENWSIKNGESMWCMPFLHKLFSKATYILVVRNGLDNILTSIPFAELYIDRMFPGNKDLPFWNRRMFFWNRINALAVRDGEQYFGDKFLIVRLEDIIKSPIQEGQRIFDHLELKFKNEYVDFVKPQASVGGYNRERTVYLKGKEKHTYNPEIHLAPLKELGRKMLGKFGYL